VEQRYRQRYLDLISNKESFDRFMKRSQIISSRAMRKYKSISNALWCVINGRAAAPPASLCKTGG
jgi:hypothetical protein